MIRRSMIGRSIFGCMQPKSIISTGNVFPASLLQYDYSGKWEWESNQPLVALFLFIKSSIKREQLHRGISMLYHERQVAKPSLLEEVRSLVYAHWKPSMSCTYIEFIFNLHLSHCQRSQHFNDCTLQGHDQVPDAN